MFKSLSKIFSKTQESKRLGSSYGGLFSLGSTNNFSFSSDNVKWMQYYATVAPVGDAIDKIADKACRIPLMLFELDDKEAEKPVNDNSFLKLLKRPNPYQTQQDFIQEFIVHGKATGNNYVYLTGGINETKDRIIGEPAEIYNLRPDFVIAVPDPRDGRALYYQNTQASGNILTFNRGEIKDINGKWVEAYIESKGNGILYNFKNTTSRRASGYYQLYGAPPLQSCEIQIAQFLEVAVYNYFLIVNGMSARKLFSLDSKEVFGQAQKDVLKKFIDENFSGAVNSGRSIVSPIPLKVDDLQIGLKDMDFKSLNEAITKVVYGKLNISLPLIDSQHTSMNNMQISELMLYDNAILPALETFCECLFTFIFKQRYKYSDDFLRLGFNPSSIGALQPRMADNLKKYKESGVLTINELREYQGLGRIDADGCDEIYISTNQTVVGKDTNLVDTIGIDKEEDKKKQIEIILRQQLKPDGSSIYGDAEIKGFLENTSQ